MGIYDISWYTAELSNIWSDISGYFKFTLYFFESQVK